MTVKEQTERLTDYLIAAMVGENIADDYDRTFLHDVAQCLVERRGVIVPPYHNAINEDENNLWNRHSPLAYHGLYGSIQYDESDKVYYGASLNTTDLVTYEADTIDGLEPAFKEAVDDYLLYRLPLT